MPLLPARATLVLLAAVATPHLAIAQGPPIVTPFTAGIEGWVTVAYPFRSHVAAPSTAVLPHDPDSGLPPGSVRVGDVFGETGIAAPAAYLGDMRPYYGGMLRYDILIRFSDNVVYPAVVLNGGTTSLYYDTDSPVVGSWESRAVPFYETGWKVAGTGLPATQPEFMAVLQNLAGLYIYTEWHSGPDDTNVDNVSLVYGTAGVPRNAPLALEVTHSPNPARGRVTISLSSPHPGPVDVALYDVSGQLVRAWSVPGSIAERRSVVWDGIDAGGRRAPSGVYFCQVVAGTDRASRRIVLTR